MRSDLYPRLTDLPILMSLKEGDGQFDLLPPTMREIGQIIRLPAAAAGLRFELRAHTAERLDDTIRDAAAGNAAALPLLEFLLEELYKRRSHDNVLTFRAYEELGGVAGALGAARRRSARDGQPGGAQHTAADLAGTGELECRGRSTPLRLVAPLAAFASAPARELLQALLEARLFVSNLDNRGQPVVSVAHEALLEHWPRVRTWSEQNREHLRAHARLSAAMRAWEREQTKSRLPAGTGQTAGRSAGAGGRRRPPLRAGEGAGRRLHQACAAFRTIACRRNRRPHRPRRLGQRCRLFRQPRVGPRPDPGRHVAADDGLSRLVVFDRRSR